MLDIASARLRAHRNNIARYRRLLETKLTELEREYIQKRLSEEQSNLEALGSVESAFNAQCLRSRRPIEQAVQMSAKIGRW
jgi:predicted house-cleaning noncanonical NTP pyrophosphatase (MazG superfamily)